VSSYAFVNPMVALALGVLVGDDVLSPRVAVSAVLVVGAVILTMRTGLAPDDDEDEAPERGVRASRAVREA
jgi:drug/metabolite transporter (DMT)-like permease